MQFRHGTSLEEAHRTAHELQDAIQDELNGADVLIHLEPEDRVRPGEAQPQNRLMAAAIATASVTPA